MSQQQRKSYKPVPRADWSKPAPSGSLPPIQAAARTRAIRQSAADAARFVFAVDVQTDHAPALRSVIEEMGDLIAGRLGGKNTPAQEQALTAAAVALGQIRSQVFPLVPAGDPEYRNGSE